MIPMDINQGVFTLNGHVFSGYSDASDCLAFPDAAELATFKKGATGQMVASGTGEKGGKVVLKLMPNSPSVAFMAKLIKQIKNGIPVVFNGNWVNPVAGEFVSVNGGALLTAPIGTTYGKGEVAEKVYTFEFEAITETPESLLLSSAVNTVSQVTAAL